MVKFLNSLLNKARLDYRPRPALTLHRRSVAEDVAEISRNDITKGEIR
jgi:hypothetical protein